MNSVHFWSKIGQIQSVEILMSRSQSFFIALLSIKSTNFVVFVVFNNRGFRPQPYSGKPGNFVLKVYI